MGWFLGVLCCVWMCCFGMVLGWVWGGFSLVLSVLLCPGIQWLRRLRSKSPWRLERGQLRELFGDGFGMISLVLDGFEMVFGVSFAVFGCVFGLFWNGCGVGLAWF